KHFSRHARPCAGHPRLAFRVLTKKDVDGRVKPGHDEWGMPARSREANVSQLALFFQVGFVLRRTKPICEHKPNLAERTQFVRPATCGTSRPHAEERTKCASRSMRPPPPFETRCCATLLRVRAEQGRGGLSAPRKTDVVARGATAPNAPAQT